LRAIAFFTTEGAGVNLAAFDAVVDDLLALLLVQVLVSAIVVKPQPEQQQKTCPEV